MSTGSDLDLVRPVNDVKTYRNFTLPNGLNVLLIHDPRIADAPPVSSSDDGEAMSTDEVGFAVAAIGHQPAQHTAVWLVE